MAATSSPTLQVASGNVAMCRTRSPSSRPFILAARAFSIAVLLSIQINPNCKELRPKQAHRRRIRLASGYLLRQPALACARIVIWKDRRGPRAPLSADAAAQFQSDMRVSLNVANIGGFPAMLRH